MKVKTPFKTCPSCRKEWETRDAFLSDPAIDLVGYQVNFGHLKAGFFLFLHGIASCGTSMGVRVESFTDLHDGPIFRERMTGTASCPGYCLHQSALDACGNHCECAFVRDVLVKVKRWPKREEVAT